MKHLLLFVLLLSLLAPSASYAEQPKDNIPLSSLDAQNVDGYSALKTLEKAKDLSGVFHEDLIYPESGFGCANTYELPEAYASLTGEFFFGYTYGELGYATMEVYGDGALIYKDYLSTKDDNPETVKTFQVDVSGYATLKLIATASSSTAYLAGVQLSALSKNALDETP